jgi:hypothetical protein
MLPGLAFSKKPTCPGHPTCNDDPPEVGDICADFASPDFVFWRDSTDKRVSAVTVFAAESATGCEKELLRIELSTNHLHLAYSSFGEGDSFFGRIVFEEMNLLDPGQGPSVWKYDFGISSGDIQHDPEGPAMIMVNSDREGRGFTGLDLSPDTNSVVWGFYEPVDDSWAHSIRIVDIDACTTSPCTYDGGRPLFEPDDHNSDSGMYLRQPVWGPFGDRIYFAAQEEGGASNSQYVMAIKSDGSDGDNATTIFGFENPVLGDPGYRVLRSVSSTLSGWPPPRELLAIEIGKDGFMCSCAELYTLDVANCENPDIACELQYETPGIFPSWTRTGAILHSGLGNACKNNQVGLWDGTALEVLTKGYEPEAAGGG